MWGPYKRCSKKCLLLTQVHYPLPPTIASLEDMLFILPFFVNFLIKFWSILLEQKSSGQIVLFAVDDICTHCPELIFPGQELENSGFSKLADLLPHSIDNQSSNFFKSFLSISRLPHIKTNVPAFKSSQKQIAFEHSLQQLGNIFEWYLKASLGCIEAVSDVFVCAGDKGPLST